VAEGGQTDGVLSEYVVAHQDAIVAIPEHLTFVQAATLPCAGVTAWRPCFRAVKSRPVRLCW
jgi:NADPH:quinone reductase-like Zn-dependent oxidoreductase